MRRDAVENRDALVESATVLFRKDGPGIALDVIADHAGVGVGTLYRHFTDRSALMLAVLNAQLTIYEQFAESHAGGPRLLEDFFNLIGDGIAIYALVARPIRQSSKASADSAEVFKRFDKVVDAITARARRENLIASWVEPDTLALAGRLLIGVYVDAQASQKPPNIGPALTVIFNGLLPR